MSFKNFKPSLRGNPNPDTCRAMDIKERQPSTDSDDEEVITKQYKVVIIGDGAVGKTSICNSFIEGDFSKSYRQTIGVDFYVKRMEIPNPTKPEQKTFVAMQIWDIGGQSSTSKMLTKYIHGADAIVLVYDITNLASFENISDWLAVVKRQYEVDEVTMPFLALVGNKKDLAHLREVKVDNHLNFCEQNRAIGSLVSARTGDGIQKVFYLVAATLLGIKLERNQVEAQIKVVEAMLVDHDQNDPNQRSLQEAVRDAENDDRCLIF